MEALGIFFFDINLENLMVGSFGNVVDDRKPFWCSRLTEAFCGVAKVLATADQNRSPDVFIV
jgi:hypothetical protein